MLTPLAFGIPGPFELFLLSLLGLLFFGKRLPEVGKSIGKTIVEFKKGMKEVENEIHDYKPPPHPPHAHPTPAPRLTPSSAVLKFDSTPLSDVIETMHKMIGANIHVNWKALETENITKDTPITLNVSGITVAKAFELILSEASPDDKLSL